VEHNVAAPSREQFRGRFLSNLRYLRGRELHESSGDDLMSALVLTVREHLVDRFVASRTLHRRVKPKTVYYLSLEYLPGRLLADSLRATGLWQVAHDALGELGVDLTAILDAEVDPGLGNGGLGRLAACFLESLATLQYPAVGYGLR
jgi:starch phosphorylase